MTLSAKLTDKQARFVREYLVDGNGAGAALRAGYGTSGAKVSACRLLTKANVQQALQARQKADAIRLSISRENVLAGLLEAVNMGREQQNPGAMVGALREIAKLLGFFEPEVKRVEVMSGDQSSMHAKFATMTDAQLLALVEQGAAVAS